MTILHHHLTTTLAASLILSSEAWVPPSTSMMRKKTSKLRAIPRDFPGPNVNLSQFKDMFPSKDKADPAVAPPTINAAELSEESVLEKGKGKLSEMNLEGFKDKLGELDLDAVKDKFSEFGLDKVTDKLSDLNFDVSNVVENTSQIQSNIMSGPVGKRGEIYFAIQLLLVLSVLQGGLPFLPAINNLLTFLLGPGLLLVGGYVAVNSVNDLGAGLSPWPIPVEDGDLVTTGMYEKVRHPLYTGLLSVMVGLSVTTGSVERLLFCSLLFVLLEIKTEYEEKGLLEKYPTEYAKYKKDVPDKFVPSDLLSDVDLPFLNN